MVEYASTFLMSSCTNASTRADDDRDAADQHHEVDAAGADREPVEEHRVQAGAEVDAGDDHGGGVDERRHRRGAGHGVGQPGVQRELAALADDADEEARRRGEEHAVVGAGAERVGVAPADVEAADGEEQDDDADHQADVAGAGGEERLERGGGCWRLSSHQCPMSANEQRPTPSQPSEHLQRVVGDDEREHRRGEQAEHRVVVRVADVVLEVRGAVDVHEQRDQRDDEEHHHREAVHADADAELDAAVLPPGEVVHHRRDHGFAVAALGAEHAAAERAQAALVTAGGVSTRSIHWYTATHDEDERRAERDDPDLRALLRHALPEEEDQDERHRGDRGDDPAVIQHVEISPSTGRLRRDRRCARCGRSATRWPGRSRPRRPRS